MYLFFLFSVTLLFSQVDLTYYLPKNISYDQKIAKPADVLGFQVGEWHLRADQIQAYMKVLESQSDRIKIISLSQSYEERPTTLMIVTSAANHARLDQIKAERLKLTDPVQSNQVDINTLPGVLYMGYSIHGNEPSGSNSVPLVSYHLAAAQGSEIEKLLSENVILIDPSFNPDGLNRFATWANMHRGKNLVADSYNREHTEGWPSGRTNHYWFDLNRDWMPAQHPESQGRLKQYYEWLPNVLTDHHEMGTNSTFFFQPGIPSRNNPLTPQRTYDLTAKIATYHADALNQIGSFYYSEESFDDYYVGKGSSYPDLNGSVGILFEQASSRGHLQESVHGDVAFPFTIRNHFTASLSTMKAMMNMRVELNQHQKDFFKESARLADNSRDAAYVLGSNDIARNRALETLLSRHRIQLYQLSKDIRIGNYTYKKDRDFLIPLKQRQHRLIVSLFEERTTFKDSLFYDVSSWNLAHSFNLKMNRLQSESQLNSIKGIPFTESSHSGNLNTNSNYAYLFKWNSYNSARALQRLLKTEIITKVATKEFSISVDGQNIQFEQGTILIPVGMQAALQTQIDSIINVINTEDGIDVHAVNTGYTNQGIDLGSGNFAALEAIRPMILAGAGTSSSEVGEIWHLMDQRMEMPLSMIETRFFNSLNLNDYNVIIMVSGSYSQIDSNGIEKLKQWLRFGGTLIAIGSANRWLEKAKLAKMTFRKNDELNKEEVSVRRSYSKAQNFSGAQFIGGTIFKADLDLSHPIGYGFESTEIPVFKRGTMFIDLTKNPYNSPLIFKKKGLLSGFVSKENYKLMDESAAITIFGQGRGQIVSFSENPNFRAFWYGTNRLFMNAMMFGQIIYSPSY